MELSVVHAGRECSKHARLATSQGIEQANRDDPHCSAAGTAVLSSPDEVLRCHPAALRGTVATVLFTDESRFLLDMLDRRRRVWRRRGERYANCAIVEHDRYGGGSLMVWGGISVRSRTELLVLNGTLTGQHYINEVLQPVVLPFVQQHHVVLQDDNARSHRARIVQQFLQQNNVDHLDWPARAPDVANRACLGHSRPACTTESSTTKNAPSFGRSLAGGVEEDTPATDCQNHQEYASSLCGLHRCNRWTYATLTDL